MPATISPTITGQLVRQDVDVQFWVWDKRPMQEAIVICLSESPSYASPEKLEEKLDDWNGKILGEGKIIIIDPSHRGSKPLPPELCAFGALSRIAGDWGCWDNNIQI